MIGRTAIIHHCASFSLLLSPAIARKTKEKAAAMAPRLSARPRASTMGIHPKACKPADGPQLRVARLILSHQPLCSRLSRGRRRPCIGDVLAIASKFTPTPCALPSD